MKILSLLVLISYRVQWDGHETLLYSRLVPRLVANRLTLIYGFETKSGLATYFTVIQPGVPDSGPDDCQPM